MSVAGQMDRLFVFFYSWNFSENYDHPDTAEALYLQQHYRKKTLSEDIPLVLYS